MTDETKHTPSEQDTQMSNDIVNESAASKPVSKDDVSGPDSSASKASILENPTNALPLQHPNASPEPSSSHPDLISSSSSVPKSIESSIAAASASSKPHFSKAKSQSKSKPKTRRARPRRRGAGESDSEDETYPSDDDSLTSASDTADSDNEEESGEDEIGTKEVTAGKTAKRGSGKGPAFADSQSTKPAAWADDKTDAEVISFDQFNGGPADGVKSQPSGAKSKGPEKVYTEEQTRRYEERKAKLKEKQKAKRAELKEAKRKERESESASAAANQAKGKGRRSDPTESNLIASTSALALDEPVVSSRGVELLPDKGTDAPAQAGRRNSKAANDPKVTPRIGQFWTHDQRNETSHGDASSGFDQTSGYGRGRGGSRGFRGGPGGSVRGRGRGFPPVFGRGGLAMAGGAAAGQRGVELAPEEPTRGKKKSGEAGELEMDKLWAEMEAKERARAERQVEQKPAEDNEADAKESVPAESASTPVEGAVASAATTSKPTVNGASKEREQKWGHEGFESMKAVDQFQSNRGFMRGRGRGRGAFAPVPGRGGVPNVFRQRFPPAFRPPFGAPTGPRSAAAQIIPAGSAIQSSSVSKTPATPSRSSSAKATEDSLTQSGLDDMIAPVSQTVTVRLPGGIEQIVKLPPATTQAQSVPIQAASQTAPSSSAPSPVPRLNSSGEFVPLSSRTPNSIPEFIPSTNPSPAPQAIPQFTGSDHGSISSAGPGPAVPIPTPGYFPQGLALGPNGEYFNLATGLPAEYSASSAPQRQFYPQQRFNHQSMQSQQFYPPPQSYSPDHFGAGAPAAPPMMNGRSNTSTGPSNHQHHPSMQMSAGSYPSPAGQGVYFSPIPQDGRGSPFSPYSPGPMGSSAANGFFAPPQSRKVSIKAPTTNSEEVQGKDAQGSNPSGVKPNSDAAQAAQSAQYLAAQAAVAQGYNPYASINGGYPGEMMNGNTTNGMMSMNGGGGQHGMYYNQWQGQGGAGMGGGQPEYGYAEYGY